MSNERDSLWVIAVIAVVVIAVPIVMIGFPASDDGDEGVKVTLECNAVSPEDWNSFLSAMKVRNWSNPDSSEQILVKYYPGSMLLKDDTSSGEEGLFTKLGRDIGNSSGGKYILQNIEAFIPKSVKTVADFEKYFSVLIFNVVLGS